MAYTPIPSIPTPEFGLTESHLMYTGSSYTYNYGSGYVPYRTGEYGPYSHYIDIGHTGATDTANPFGTPDRPRRTWTTGLASGSVVQIAQSGPRRVTSGNNGVEIGSGGAGYAVNDLLHVVGGVFSTGCKILVTATGVNGTIVTGHVTERGSYTVRPSGPLVGLTGSAGTGAAVYLHWSGYSFNNQSNSMRFHGDATQDYPTFFIGIGTGEAMPIINRAVGTVFWFCNWSIIDGIKFERTNIDTRPLIKGDIVHHICIRNCIFTGNGIEGNSAISTGGSSGTSETAFTHHIVIWNVTASYLGDWLGPNEDDACLCIFGDFCSDAWMLDCEGSYINGDGTRLGADQDQEITGGRLYIGRCHFHHNRENAVDVKKANDWVVAECIFHSFFPVATANGEALVIHYGPQNGWIINCIFYDCNRGIVSTDVTDTVGIVGNLFYDIVEDAIYPDRGGGTFYIYNNTIIGGSNGINSTQEIDALYLKNNLIFGSSGDYLNLTSSTARSGSSVVNECYYNPTGNNVAIRWGTLYTGVSGWIAGTTVGDNSIQLNPIFYNTGLRDYRLQSGSPCLTSGVDGITSLNAMFQSGITGAPNLTLFSGISGASRFFQGNSIIGAFNASFASSSSSSFPVYLLFNANNPNVISFVSFRR